MFKFNLFVRRYRVIQGYVGHHLTTTLFQNVKRLGRGRKEIANSPWLQHSDDVD